MSSPTPDADVGLRQACSDTIYELTAARKLIASQGVLIEKDQQLQATQDQLANGLKNLRTMDAAEKQNLRDALTAADKQLDAFRSEIVVLKKKQVTFWKVVKYVLIGAAGGIVAGAVLSK